MLDVKRMRILREVAEQGSFSAAADALHLTQSAISQQVATLERETGTTLIQRSKRNGVLLTEPGRALIAHADAVICRLEEAERELADIAGLRAGRLRILTFPTAGATLSARAIGTFGKRHPEVELVLAEAEPEDAIPQLRRGEWDLALVYDFEYVPLEEQRDLERHFLLEERMQVALPKDHALAGQASIRLEELSGENWICGMAPCSCGENVRRSCRNSGFEPRIGFQSDDYQVHMSLVAAGLGISMMPELLLTGRHPSLRFLDVVPEPPMRRIWALTLASDMRAPAAEEMLEVLRSESAKLEKRAAVVK
jgi:DNA-binding transcriptional LysR family regulator